MREARMLNVQTFSESLRAAGAGMALVDSVVAASKMKREPPVGFALIRPPGHHAVPSGPMGFCIFGNIAIAARHAQRKHGVKKILIIDFDVHHGNGTNDAFYNDPDIYFLSTHQAGSYPGTGKIEDTGNGAGEGATLNLPLPGGSGDGAMSAVFDEVIVPVAQRFKPDLILVSAGARVNFITPQLAEKMGIKTDEMGPAYTTSMAALGHEVAVTPLIGKLRLHIQGYVGHEEFFIMPLEGCDVLLSMLWFYNHKAVLDSFNKKITLENRGRKIVLDVKLKGESVPSRLMKQHISAYLIYVKEKDETETSNLSSLDVSRRAFSDEYADYFSEALPGQLPPEHPKDYIIDLILGSAAPNKPPYRVNAAQQEEIMMQAKHMEHLRAVYEMLRKERLVVNEKKSEFFMEEIHFLGHIVSKDGVRMDPAKIMAIQNWPESVNLHESARFVEDDDYEHQSLIEAPMYDGHVLDPLAGLQFTTGTFYRLAANIKSLAGELCGGRCVFFLEGGYNLKSLSDSISETFRAFLGEESLASKFDNPAVLYDEPSLVVRKAIDQIKSIHSL
ncbi:hypothetical protein L7F22_005252 [Adiantum nelumboides]|nr:hypothetical protein [Adiantum nelumboides]